jgi:hypothetical protein
LLKKLTTTTAAAAAATTTTTTTTTTTILWVVSVTVALSKIHFWKMPKIFQTHFFPLVHCAA